MFLASYGKTLMDERATRVIGAAFTFATIIGAVLASKHLFLWIAIALLGVVVIQAFAARRLMQGRPQPPQVWTCPVSVDSFRLGIKPLPLAD